MAPPEPAKPEVRTERLARVLDREVAPIWHDRFAKLLLRHVTPRRHAVAIDVHCGSGRTTSELLRRLPDSSRVLALGHEPTELILARARIDPAWLRRVYFKEGNFDDVLEMPDATYDLSVANLVLTEQVLDWEAGLGELVRITKPGGTALASIPLAGTWAEAEDLLDEALRDLGQTAGARTLDRFRRRRPSTADLVRGLDKLGIAPADYVIEHERFHMLFRSGREFLFAPVIEHGPLALWKAIIGDAEQAKRLFWQLKQSIDTYYRGRVFAVSVVAAVVVVGRRGEDGRATAVATDYWRRYPTLGHLWQAPPPDDGIGIDIDIDIDIEAESRPETETPTDETHVDEDDLEELFEGAFELQPTRRTIPPAPPPPGSVRATRSSTSDDPSDSTSMPTVTTDGDPGSSDSLWQALLDREALSDPTASDSFPVSLESHLDEHPSAASSSSRFPSTVGDDSSASSGSGRFIRPPSRSENASSSARFSPPPSPSQSGLLPTAASTEPPNETNTPRDPSEGSSDDSAPPYSAPNPVAAQSSLGLGSASDLEADGSAPADATPVDTIDPALDVAAARRRFSTLKATQMLQAVPSPPATSRARGPRRGRWGRHRGSKS